MRVGRHGRVSRLLSAVDRDAQPIRKIGAQLVNRGPNIEAEVGRNLFIAAAAAVQLVSRVANQRDQLLLDKVVHVFRFVVVEKGRRRRAFSPICVKALKNGDQLARRQDSRILQR